MRNVTRNVAVANKSTSNARDAIGALRGALSVPRIGKVTSIPYTEGGGEGDIAANEISGYPDDAAGPRPMSRACADELKNLWRRNLWHIA